MLKDPENFIPANPLVTCLYSTRVIFFNSLCYFTFDFNELGGVIALTILIIILIVCPFIYKRKFQGYMFYPVNKFLF